MGTYKILIKYSASKCNKEMVEFLIRNMGAIKKRCSFRVLVVFDEDIPLIKGKINKLPALLVGSSVVTGNSAIRKILLPPVGPAKVKQGFTKDMGSSDLQDYWSQEMHAKDDNNMDETTDIMEAVKTRALQQSMQHREKHKKKPKQRKTIVSTARDDNIAMGNIQGEKISDMVADDPIMAKYWENQEESPM
jgi:hypothetical protein